MLVHVGDKKKVLRAPLPSPLSSRTNRTHISLPSRANRARGCSAVERRGAVGWTNEGSRLLSSKTRERRRALELSHVPTEKVG